MALFGDQFVLMVSLSLMSQLIMPFDSALSVTSLENCGQVGLQRSAVVNIRVIICAIVVTLVN